MWKLIQSRLIHFLRSGLELGLSCLPNDAVASSEEVGPDGKTEKVRGLGYNTLHPRRRAREALFKRLLTPAASAHTGRNNVDRYSRCTLSLSTADAAGAPTNCPNATTACISACTGGPNGAWGAATAEGLERIHEFRNEKTRFLQSDRSGFVGQLMDEIEAELFKANRDGCHLAIQLNEFSDLAWESREYGEVPQQFPDVLFYDFTRRYDRIREAPENYKLIASWTPEAEDQSQCIELLKDGYPISIVFAESGERFFGGNAGWQRLPKSWTLGGQSFRVFDCEFTLNEQDFFRHLNKSAGVGVIYGLRLRAFTEKARQSAIASGFCVVVNHN